MSAQLLPSAELAPSDLSELPIEKRAAVWLEMLDAGYKLVMAGLARESCASSCIEDRYRGWYADQMVEHDRVVERMLNRMQGHSE
jgi:hypothetical protein